MTGYDWFAWYPVRDPVTRKWYFREWVWAYRWNSERPWRYEDVEFG